MPFNILLVGEEREVGSFQPVLEAAARKAGVGPFKVFSAHRAADGVSQLSSTGGKCDAAFLDNKFTHPGKEEFSDALRKVLKDKYPNTPVICWGHPDKGGKKGEHFHHTLDSKDPGTVADMLARVKAGELVAMYGGKPSPAAKARKSMDSDGARKSMDGPASPGSASMEHAPSMRRKSLEVEGPQGSMTRMASGRVPSFPQADLGMPGMDRMGSFRGVPSVPSMTPMLASMGSMARMGSMTASMTAGLPAMGSMGSMTASMPAGVPSGMPAMTSMGSMTASMTAGMPAMTSMGSMTAGMTAGMPAMTPMAGMGAPMTPMTGMPPMAGMPGTGMPGMPAMTPMTGMPAMTPMTGMTPMTSMTPMTGMTGMLPMTGMAPMTSPTMPGMLTAPAAASAAAPAAADTSTLMANLGLGSGGQVSNSEIIRMLADEVVRLRAAVAQKKSRASLEGSSMLQARVMV